MVCTVCVVVTNQNSTSSALSRLIILRALLVYFKKIANKYCNAKYHGIVELFVVLVTFVHNGSRKDAFVVFTHLINYKSKL